MPPSKTESLALPSDLQRHSGAFPADTSLTGLEAACARAIARAQFLRRPIAVAASEPAPKAVDPLAALAALGSEESAGAPARRFYFEQPVSGFALAAGGSAGIEFGKEPTPRQALETALADAEAWAPEDQSPIGAHAVGGFAFFDTLDAQQWPGFEPADLVLPAWAVVRKDGTPHSLVQTFVSARDDAATVARRLIARLARVRAAASAPLPEGGTVPVRVEGLDPQDARPHWMQVVRSARDAVRKGRLRKVVLARPLDLTCTPAPDPLALLVRLRTAYPECYTFLADPGAGLVYLGASPERLAHMQEGRVSLGALAGTFPRGATPEADAALKRMILESPKEREEHGIVVDTIREAVAGFGRVDLPDEPEVRPLKNVWHLFTPIALIPEGRVSLLALVERLHPTPAVGGLPREPALDLIRSLESFDRGWYGSPLGWLNAHGDGEFAVTLRSGVVSGNKVRLFAGGGIVADSDPEREFEETRIKFQPLLGALGQE